MPDTPVAPSSGEPYDPSIGLRLSRLEEEMREERAARSQVEAAIIRIEAILPHLATKEDIAALRSDLRADIARVERKAELAAILAEAAGAKAEAAGNKAEAAGNKADAAASRADAAANRVDAAANKAELAASKADFAVSKVDAIQSDVAQIRADVTRLEVALADKPGKLYMWGVLTALLTAYACGLAALAILR